MQRIDLLIISVSGAGIYSCWDILKFLAEKKLTSDLTMLRISGFLFLFTIILNFIGQWSSFQANSKDEYSKRLEIDEIEKNV